MTLLTELAHTLQTLFTVEAADIARATGCVRRQRKLSGPLLAQTLVFGWLQQPDASLEDLADMAADLGAEIWPQALDQRFTAATSQFLVNLLAAGLDRVIAGRPVIADLAQRFTGIYVYDSTTLALPAALAAVFPGCGGSSPTAGRASLKCHVGLELTRGTLEITLGPGRLPDVSGELARSPLPEGALRLADRGYFDMGVLADYDQQGVFWISRLPPRLLVTDGQGPTTGLAEFLKRQTGDAVDTRVVLGEGGRLPCRLLARRLPRAVVARRQERLRKQARKKGRRVSPASLVLCGWNVYITNAGPEQLRWSEVWVLARSRWQIELLFKLWKSHGGLEKSQGGRPLRVLCEVYAKLLGMVVQHWTLLICGGSFLEISYPKAARRLRRLAGALVQALAAVETIVAVLERVQRRLAQRCRVQQRRDRPSTLERLRDPDGAGLADEQKEGDTPLQVA
jgi:hypothetical protein